MPIRWPGTPPLQPPASLTTTRQPPSQSSSAKQTCQRYLDSIDPTTAYKAACTLQRVFLGLLARRTRVARASATGRPVHFRVQRITNLTILRRYRDLDGVYCVVSVLKKPFGPFMFEYRTSVMDLNDCADSEWDDQFFLPCVSSKCVIVVTVVGVADQLDRPRFIGQSVLPLGIGWETKPGGKAPLGPLVFPMEESLAFSGRFIEGIVEFTTTQLFANCSVKTGQFLVEPSSTRNSTSTWWPRKSLSSLVNKVGSAVSLVSPTKTSKTNVPSPLESPLHQRHARSKCARTHWGVLTETHLHLFDTTSSSSSSLVKSFELGKMQLIKSWKRRECVATGSMPLFPVKIYHADQVHVLYVSSEAQQYAWEWQIDQHRRRLLIP